MSKKHEKLGVTALAFFVFASSAAGSFGIESCVKLGGPLVALLLVILLPIFCTTPLIFMIEELTSWSPSRHGNIKFVYLAFGPKVGFLNGFFTIVLNLIDLPVYAVYGINYLVRAFGQETFDRINNNFAALYFMRAAFVLVFGLPSFFEIKEMGIVTGILTVLIASPFVVGFFAGVGNIDTTSWGNTVTGTDFGTLLSLANFLYLGFLANASISGEVKQRALFKGQLIGLFCDFLIYFLPLIVTLQLNTNYKEWTDAYLVELFDKLLKGLGPCVSVAGFLSGAALFSTSLVCYTRSIWAVANLGWLPKVFLKTNRYNSPYWGAVLHLFVCLVLITFDFEFLVELEFLFATTLIVLFSASFVMLRFTEPPETRLSPRFVARHLTKANSDDDNNNNNERDPQNRKSQQQQQEEEQEGENNQEQNKEREIKDRQGESDLEQLNPNATSTSSSSSRVVVTSTLVVEGTKTSTSKTVTMTETSALSPEREAITAAVGGEEHSPIVLEDGFEDDDEEDLGVFVVPGGNCFAAGMMPIPLIFVMSATLAASLTDFKMLGAYLTCYALAGCLFYYLNYCGKTEEEIVARDARMRSSLVSGRGSEFIDSWSEVGVGEEEAEGEEGAHLENENQEVGSQKRQHQHQSYGTTTAAAAVSGSGGRVSRRSMTHSENQQQQQQAASMRRR